MAEWILSGVNKVRGKFEPITGTVEAKGSGSAMKKARKLFPNAPELSVQHEAAARQKKGEAKAT